MTRDEIIATSLLLGEDVPPSCHYCRGSGVRRTTVSAITCHVCSGIGMDVSDKTWNAIKDRVIEGCRRVR